MRLMGCLGRLQGRMTGVTGLELYRNRFMPGCMTLGTVSLGSVADRTVLVGLQPMRVMGCRAGLDSRMAQVALVVRGRDRFMAR